MTRHTQHLTGIAVAAVTALSLSACNNAAGGTGGESTSSSTTSTSTSSTPSPSKTETLAEREKREAGEAVVAMWGGIDDLASDPNKPLSDLANFAVGQALTHWQRSLTLMRGDAVTQVGSVVVENVEATAATKSKTYEVSACIDVSKVNVVDKDGKSVVAADRQARTKYVYEVSKIDEKFFVSEAPLQGEPC